MASKKLEEFLEGAKQQQLLENHTVDPDCDILELVRRSQTHAQALFDEFMNKLESK